MTPRLYVMRLPQGCIKLGLSIEPVRRRCELGREVELVFQTEPIERAREVERHAHRVLALSAKHIHGEVFEATPEQARQAIRIAMRQTDGDELRLGALMKPKSVASLVRMGDPLAQLVDDWRRGQVDLPTRAEALRRLAAMALKELQDKPRGRKS